VSPSPIQKVWPVSVDVQKVALWRVERCLRCADELTGKNNTHPLSLFGSYRAVIFGIPWDWRWPEWSNILDRQCLAEQLLAGSFAECNEHTFGMMIRKRDKVSPKPDSAGLNFSQLCWSEVQWKRNSFESKVALWDKHLTAWGTVRWTAFVSNWSSSIGESEDDANLVPSKSRDFDFQRSKAFNYWGDPAVIHEALSQALTQQMRFFSHIQFNWYFYQLIRLIILNLRVLTETWSYRSLPVRKMAEICSFWWSLIAVRNNIEF
jgi:hypothetical protein